MKVWILFIWMSGTPAPDLFTYDSKAECEQKGEPYKHAVCVLVDVPKPKSFR